MLQSGDESRGTIGRVRDHIDQLYYELRADRDEAAQLKDKVAALKETLRARASGPAAKDANPEWVEFLAATEKLLRDVATVIDAATTESRKMAIAKMAITRAHGLSHTKPLTAKETAERDADYVLSFIAAVSPLFAKPEAPASPEVP